MEESCIGILMSFGLLDSTKKKKMQDDRVYQAQV